MKKITFNYKIKYILSCPKFRGPHIGLGPPNKAIVPYAVDHNALILSHSGLRSQKKKKKERRKSPI